MELSLYYYQLQIHSTSNTGHYISQTIPWIMSSLWIWDESRTILSLWKLVIRDPQVAISIILGIAKLLPIKCRNLKKNILWNKNKN